MLSTEVEEYGKFPDLPTGTQSIAEGRYKVGQQKELSVAAQGSDTVAQLWFKSPVSYSNLDPSLPRS
jgi:hypothetical protein